MTRTATIAESVLSSALRSLPIRHGAHRILDRVCPRPWVKSDAVAAFDFHGRRLTLDVSDLVGWHFFMLRSFDPEVVEILTRFASDRDIFWDVGANKGACSYQIAHALPGCKIVAIEPQSDLSALTHTNLITLGFGAADAVVLHVGLGDEEAEMSLHVPDGNKGAASLLAGDGGARKIQIRTAQWINERSGFGWPTLVKIDVEGFEPKVVRSLLPAFDMRLIRCCVFECHASEAVGFGHIRDMTASLGYAISAIRKSAFSTWLEKTDKLLKGVTDYALVPT
jgi:FkbM family methyltransferase